MSNLTHKSAKILQKHRRKLIYITMKRKVKAHHYNNQGMLAQLVSTKLHKARVSLALSTL